jgi:hypothetical protein
VLVFLTVFSEIIVVRQIVFRKWNWFDDGTTNSGTNRFSISGRNWKKPFSNPKSNVLFVINEIQIQKPKYIQFSTIFILSLKIVKNCWINSNEYMHNFIRTFKKSSFRCSWSVSLYTWNAYILLVEHRIFVLLLWKLPFRNEIVNDWIWFSCPMNSSVCDNRRRQMDDIRQCVGYDSAKTTCRPLFKFKAKIINMNVSEDEWKFNFYVHWQ